MLRFHAFMRSVRRLLGMRLKQLREEQDLGATNVAAALGVDVSHLYAIERGDNAPSLETASGMAMLYRVDVADLYVFPGTGIRHDLRELIRLTPNASLAELKVVWESLFGESMPATGTERPKAGQKK